MKKFFLAFIILISLRINAQDIQLVLPKFSIENSIKTLLDARAASFSSYTSGFGVDMYNIRLIYSASHPLIVDLIPPNKFKIQCGIIARANVNYIAGNFQINGEGNITLEALMSTEGSNGQITLYGTANTVIDIWDVPGFVLNIINANQFTVNIPKFKLATFVYTLPSIPLNYFTTDYPTISINNDNVILELQTKSNFLIVDQRDENGSRISSSQIGHWNGMNFQNYTVPKIFSNLPLNENQTFRGSQQLLLNPSQKYNSWNKSNNILNYNTFFLNGSFARLNSDFKKTYSGIIIKNNLLEAPTNNGGNVTFKDPWLIDYADPQFGNNLRNRGMDAPFKQRSSPFYPDYTTNYNGDVYKGVFLNQGSPNWTPPFYSVQAVSPQTININGRNHSFYFQNWSGSNVNFQSANNLTTGVVFTNANAVANANYKGLQLSNQTDAYENNSQRKFIRLGNSNNLLNVYKSFNKVWIEQSSNSGTNWFLKNGGIPFDNDNINEWSSPSIDYIPWNETHPFAAVVHNALKLSIIRENINIPYYSENLNINWEENTTYITPVVAVSSSGIFVICDGAEDAYGNKGLAYFYGGTSFANNNVAIQWWDGHLSPQYKVIPGTTVNSKNPTIVADKINTAHNIFHIAWEENNQIKYCKATGVGSSLTFSPVLTASASSGYTVNHSPVITELYQNSFYVPKLVWIGERMVYSDKEKEIQKIGESEGGTLERKVLFRDYYDGSWSPLFTFGNDVVSASINKKSTDGYVIAWSQETTSSYLNKYIRNTSFSTIYDYNTTGKEIQLCNGNNYTDMFVMSFNQSQTPYNFTLSNPSNGIPFKENIITYSSGREGVIKKGEGQFYFGIGDIKKDGEAIEFIELYDTVRINTLNDVNTYLTSQTFMINNNSTVYYSIQYGISDSVSVVNSLGENDEINFKLELVNAQNGSVIGTFDEVTFNADNLYQYNNIAYQLQTDGISNTEVLLRLKVETNFDNGQYLVAAKYADEDVILKTNYKNISLSDITGIKDFALIQNYPNPFNPVTIISYQLPQEGFVTLKVYDILGREVATLVNEQKSVGRYNVNFNASQLSSGVYVYKVDIKGNDETIFSDIKKMMLLK